jgi:preprotein translocase subunit SecG
VAILIPILNTLAVLICLFMICLILIQRGKGGGLAGAFGGVGGSSAFGTKAGDVFTRVTMIAAAIWIVLSMLLVVAYNRPRKSAFDDGRGAEVSKEVSPKKTPGKAPTTDAGVTGAGAGTTSPEPSSDKPASPEPSTGATSPVAPASTSTVPAAIPEPSAPASK